MLKILFFDKQCISASMLIDNLFFYESALTNLARSPLANGQPNSYELPGEVTLK